MNPRAFAASLLLAAVLAMPLFAQTATTRIAGTVASFDGQTVSVKRADQSVVTVLLPAGIEIGAVVDRKLSDIKPGDFVGSAAVKGMDGKLHAQEVHIFPEDRRGSGEGHRPMGEPEQTMTNATVAEVATISDGRTLRLKYPGGEQVIDVAPGTRVVMFVKGDNSLLKPCAAIRIQAATGGDGKLVARSVQAEKDGVKPLM